MTTKPADNSKPAELERLFNRALEIESDSDRARFLDEHCDDPGLRAELDELLSSHRRLGSFLQIPAKAKVATVARSGADDGSAPDATPRSILKRIGRLLGETPQIVLRESRQELLDPIARVRSTEIPTLQAESRYQLQGEIARGGMGAIIKGRDVDLGRDLAVKVLLDSHKDKPEIVQRFDEEAQIAGQLQHPGLAPVYELGQFSDDRPFFTMKLVKGETLATLLSERQDIDHDRMKYLGIFEQICQTLAYAHSRGVIHRDLKPANIMVGAFGEVQVMDWGLAKVLSAGGVADEKKAHETHQDVSIIRTLRSSDSETSPQFGSQTQMGSVMGTPAYMPPEQALGEIDHLDERADVFGLGAILCEILTGKPPYVGETTQEVFRMASRGKLDACRERLNSSGADPDLIQLARDCVALEPVDRPRNAGVLADRVTGYLESVETKLRTTELERAAQVARTEEERKRKKVILALAASILLLMSLVGGGVIWAQKQQAILAQTTAESAREALLERQKLETKIRDELAAATTLVGESATDSLNLDSLEMAYAAVRRAIELAKGKDVDATIVAQAESLETKLQQQLKDVKMVNEQEDIWAWETQQAAEKPKLGFFQMILEQNRSAVDDSLDSGAAKRYAKAFQTWGITPMQDSIPKAIKKIHALPETDRAVVLVSLTRWADVLSGEPTLEAWQKKDWNALKPIKLSSRGDNKLEVLPNESILASGPTPRFGYDLEFETDATSITALRLETLLHESLLGGGPGRGEGGGFGIRGLEVSVAPGDDPDAEFQPIELASIVVSDYLVTRPPTPTSWEIGSGEKRCTAVFRAASVLRSASGFRIRISHADRANDMQGNRNLGCFRWSVTADGAADPAHTWIAELADQSDRDPWRRGMRKEIADKNLSALVRRARAFDSLKNKPRFVLVRLASALRNLSAIKSFDEFSNEFRWQSMQSVSVQSNREITWTATEEHSIVLKGEDEKVENLQVIFPVQEYPVQAIRLELIAREGPDGNSAIGRSDNGQVALHEFEVHFMDGVEDPKPFRATISEAMFDLPGTTGNNVPRNVIDRYWATYFQLPSPAEDRQFILFLDPDDISKDDTHLRLSIAAGPQRALGTFRVSATTDFRRFKFVAHELLRRVQADHPGDYWINLELAELSAELSWPEESLRYATAALAARPDSAHGHASFLQYLCNVDYDPRRVSISNRATACQ